MEKKVKKPIVTKDGVSLAYHLMEYYLGIASFINAVPFDYDKKAHHFSFRKKSLKYVLWLIFMPFGMFCELSQVTFALYRSAVDPTVSKGESALILFLFLSWVLINALHYNTFSRSEDIVNYLNQAIQMRTYFGEENLPYTSDHKAVRGHISTSCLQCFFQCLMVATEGLLGRTQYLYSNVPENYQSVPLAAVWVVYVYYRVITNFLTGYWGIFNCLFHVMTCNQILHYRTTTNMSLDEEVKTYRMLQLLNNRYNATYSTIFLPFITGFAAGNIILGNFGTLRFFETMDFDKYLNFPLMAFMMMLMTFTLYPNNATVKEITDYEKNRMRWANVKMTQAVLQKVDLKRRAQLEKLVTESEDVIMVRPNTVVDTETEISTVGAQESIPIGRKLEEMPMESALIESQRPGVGLRMEMREQVLLVARLKKLTAYVRSCPAIGVQMGTFYAIKSSTVLNIFDFIICNTISALLTT